MDLIAYRVFFLFLAAFIAQQHPAFEERVEERYRMVKNDIEHYARIPVSDPEVLEAMRRVPRHVFVPENRQGNAYENRPLPIGYEQTISQPVIVAHMTQLLDLKSGHRVLEIGTGSGYQAAVLAELCDSVFSMEIIAPLGENARRVLQKLGYHHVSVRIGNGYEGWASKGPFDRMIVTCAPDHIPEALKEQLAPGGLIVIPVGGAWQTQSLVVVRKTRKGKFTIQKQYPVRFVPMTGEK